MCLLYIHIDKFKLHSRNVKLETNPPFRLHIICICLLAFLVDVSGSMFAID